MKKMVSFLSLLTTLTFAQNPSADAILDSVEHNQNPQTTQMEMVQRVHHSDGSISESKLMTYSIDKGEKGISIYSEPARINGMKILTLNDGDDIWFYSPRTGRTRKIASHQKNQSVNGSDFSYEDLSTKDQRKEYNSTIIGSTEIDGVQCVTLQLTLKEGVDKSYKKIIMNIDTTRWLPLKSEFYDEEGLWKILTLKDIVKVGLYWTAQTIIMKNVLKDSYTEMIAKNIQFNSEIDPSMFTQRYLSR